MKFNAMSLLCYFLLGVLMSAAGGTIWHVIVMATILYVNEMAVKAQYKEEK